MLLQSQMRRHKAGASVLFLMKHCFIAVMTRCVSYVSCVS
ncbi:Uncharacterised protein [Vibrio cholerae]|nr:Uncharacterised protein [Vibrio cholerae]